MNKKSLFKRLFATLTSLTVLATCTITTAFFASADEETNPAPTPYNMEVISDAQRIYTGENYEVDYSITSAWDDIQMISITVTNTGTEPIGNWSLLYDFGGEIQNIYNAEVKENDYFSYIAHSNNNFGEITPNSSTNFGYTLVGAENNYFPNSIDMVQSRQEISEGLTIELANIYDAYDTFGGQLILTNTTDNQICMPEITINTNFSLLSNWGYDIINLGGNTYTIASKFDTGIFINIPPNSSYTLQISGSNVENPQIESFSATELVVSEDEYLERDSDGDDLPDYCENEIYSDKYNPDTDGDLLIDGYEELLLLTSSLLPDTDDNGISDADEDFDNDTLSNLQEYEIETDPFEPDTDDDTISDNEEISLGTDPRLPDSDIDGLLDGEEGYTSAIYTKYGVYFDPINPDTDDNGILDGDERLAQNVQKEVITSDGAITNISVEMITNGNLDENLTIESMMDKDWMSSNVVGLVGEPFDFSTTSNFDEAKITFTIDQTKLGETGFEDLLFLWYDEENDNFQEFETSYDEENSTVSVETTHFSQYMVVDGATWYKIWGYDSYVDLPDKIDYIPTNLDNSGIAYEFPKDKQSAINQAAVYNGHSYLFIPTTLSHYGYRYAYTWNEAQSRCENWGGHLVTISSQAEQNFIESVMSETGMNCYWIGGNYVNGKIEWITGEDVTFNNFDHANSSVYMAILGQNHGYPFASWYAAYSGFPENLRYNSIVGFICEWDSDVPEIFADTDGDKLYDFYERNGMRIQNGNIVYTNPNTEYTDSDKLTDGEEIDPLLREKKIYTNQNDYHISRYLVMKSDPHKEDSDDDFIPDNDDLQRMEYNYFKEIGTEEYNKRFGSIIDYFLLNKSGRINLMMNDVNNIPESYLDLIPQERWLYFCNDFNETIKDYSKHNEITEEIHYFRNKLNRYDIPETLDEMINLINSTSLKSDKWIMCSPYKSRFHMFGIDGEYNIKFISSQNTDAKFEAVYDRNGNLITENDNYGENMGTYNYANPDKDSRKHTKYDVDTYEEWGNTYQDTGKSTMLANNNYEQVFTEDAEDYYRQICQQLGVEYKEEGYLGD